ncbi:MAG: hypothetical protein IPK46_10260 [Saprospiraceae bacterium]|nr:hypothetical protein [Saprospiraceae bacterium]
MKKFNSPKVGGGKTLIGKNSIDFYKRWLKELFINPSVPFSFILMAVMSFYFYPAAMIMLKIISRNMPKQGS